MNGNLRAAAALLASAAILCGCTASTSVASTSPSPSPSASPSQSAAASPSEGAGSCPTAEPTPSATSPSPTSTPSPAGPNLLQNPGGEADTGATDSAPIVTPSGWTVTAGEPDVVQYGASGGFPTPDDPGPGAADRGKNFFGGGNAVCSEMTQTVDLSNEASAIDGGHDSYYLAAWLGGYDGQSDFATFTVTFSPSGTSATVGPVTQADRQGESGLQLRAITGAVPAGTRSATVRLQQARFSGLYNDGYADLLWLAISTTS